jgi:hypothetical protein
MRSGTTLALVAGMSAVALRSLHDALAQFPTETTSEKVAFRPDAELGIAELKALREVNYVASPELAQDSELLVGLYRGDTNGADALRLEQRTQLDGPSMRSAVGRILATEITPGGSPEQLEKEAKMRRLLGALDVAVGSIQQQTIGRRG